MEVEIVAEPDGGYQFASSYLIDGRLAIDAGTLGWISNLDKQRAVTDLLLTHPHLDHIASLPVFLENVFGRDLSPPRIWLSEPCEEALRAHCFNDVLWPNLPCLENHKDAHFCYRRVEAEVPVSVLDYAVTPLVMDHIGCTFGYLVDDGRHAIALVTDTGSTDDAWRILKRAPRLDAILLECAFPNRMSELADQTRHLTPQAFAAACDGLQRARPGSPLRIIPIHMKAAFHDEVASELIASKIEGIEFVAPGRAIQLN